MRSQWWLPAGHHRTIHSGTARDGPDARGVQYTCVEVRYARCLFVVGKKQHHNLVSAPKTNAKHRQCKQPLRRLDLDRQRPVGPRPVGEQDGHDVVVGRCRRRDRPHTLDSLEVGVAAATLPALRMRLIAVWIWRFAALFERAGCRRPCWRRSRLMITGLCGHLARRD